MHRAEASCAVERGGLTAQSPVVTAEDLLAQETKTNIIYRVSQLTRLAL